MKKLLAFLFTTILLTTCAGKAAPQEEAPAISDSAKSLETAVGAEFKIVIDSNPSTGYHWELAENPDESIVKFVSKYYNPKTSAAPGSSGQEVWVFKALKAGEAHITLWYYSPSNEPANPQQNVTFTVTVK